MQWLFNNYCSFVLPEAIAILDSVAKSKKRIIYLLSEFIIRISTIKFVTYSFVLLNRGDILENN